MNLIKDNFFILTGGPGAGKSTLLQGLHRLGYDIVHETARSVIQDRVKQGLAPRPSPREFARQLFAADLEKFQTHLFNQKTVFFDRSFLDSACMVSSDDAGYFQQIAGILCTHRFNRKVFIVPPWKEIFRTDSERDQTFEQSVDIYNRLFEWYSEHGYHPVVIPKADVGQRIQYVLSAIEY